MAIRQRLSTLVNRTVSGVRRVIEPQAVPTPDAATEARIQDLEKRISMMMGAIQAATAQLAQLRAEVAHAKNQANQAMQRATTAQTTAEAAADGVTGSESQIGALMERLARQGSAGEPPGPRDPP